jgi:hypothetical protein
MSYPQSTRDQFLSLRADGLSYAQCAKQLNVSRHTLINWAKDLKPQLDAIRTVRSEEVLEKVQLRLEQRILLLADLYHRIYQVLAHNNLRDSGIGPLFTALLKLNTALDKYELDSSSPSLAKHPFGITARLAGRVEAGIEETLQTPSTDPEKIELPLTPEPETPKTASQPLVNSELEKTEPKLNHLKTLTNSEHSSLTIRENQCCEASVSESSPLFERELQKLHQTLEKIDRAEAKINRQAS